MEVGCLRHPGASTIGSQFLGGDCSHGWQILATQPWAPTQEREISTHHSGKREGRLGKTALTMSCHSKQRCKFTLKAQARMPQMKRRWNSESFHMWKLLIARVLWCSLFLTLLNCIYYYYYYYYYRCYYYYYYYYYYYHHHHYYPFFHSQSCISFYLSHIIIFIFNCCFRVHKNDKKQL